MMVVNGERNSTTMVDENRLHLVGGLERLVTLAQRALDVFGIGVSWNVSMVARRQRHGHAVEHAAILALKLQRTSARFSIAVMASRSARHVTASSEQGLHQASHGLDMRLLAQRLGRQLPHLRERRIE